MKSRFSLPISMICCLVGGSLQPSPASAQVVEDGTTSTVVEQNGDDFTIKDGDRAGSNLFHSFQDFSVPNGGSAFFDNAADIANIFSRVTGGNISNIDGLIRTNDASLFLINPAGIIFGAGARLDLGGGSFYGSSADSILFEDGEFSATDLDNPPLLTINAPIGLSFRDNPGTITNNSVADGVGLQVNTGEKIVLVGGDIDFEGGKVFAPGGGVELGGLSAAGTIAFNDNGSLSFPDGVARSDISLNNGAVVDVRSGGGGFITVNARNLELLRSNLFAGISEGLGEADAVAGDINLTANSISLIDFSSIRSEIFGGEGTVGDINLTANSISLTSGFEIVSVVRNGKGTVGDINLTANSIFLTDDFSSIRSEIFGGEGTVGDINLTANSISLTTGLIGSGIFDGKGTIGDTNLIADSISLNHQSLIASLMRADGKGTIGDINLTANSISLTDDFSISISTLSGSAIFSVVRNGEGTVGDINLTADFISIANQTKIFTETYTSTSASNIEIVATELIEISGIDSSISSQTGGQGNAGNISINSPELRVLDGSQISANNFLVESFSVSLSGRLIRDILEQPLEGSGSAGTIDITADNITLEDRGGITALSSAGEGGNIQLQVDDSLSLRNNSEISATAGIEGTPGNGGNIDIDSTLIVAFPNQNNDITANAFEGSGGRINIATEGIFGIKERSQNPLTNDITASSGLGLDGTISITTPDVNAIQPDTDLPNNPIESQETVAQACRSDRLAENTGGGLIIKGKGGIPPKPTEPFDSDAIIVGERLSNLSPQVQSLNVEPISTSIGDIYPARGIIKTEDGQVILTAYPTDSIDTRTPYISANCS